MRTLNPSKRLRKRFLNQKSPSVADSDRWATGVKIGLLVRRSRISARSKTDGEQGGPAGITYLPKYVEFCGPSRSQKFATVFRPNTNAFGLAVVPPGLITYWMFGRTCRPAS